MSKTLLKVFISVLALPLLGSAVKVQALTLFSDRDINLAPGNAVPPLTDFPNSSQAEADLLSELEIGIATEDFESFTPGQSSPLSLVFPVAGEATLVGNGFINTNSSERSLNGAYAISGDQNFLIRGGETFTIDFDQPIAAFGFYVTDLGSEILLNLDLVNGGTESVLVEATERFGSNRTRQSGSVQYEGVLADSPAEYFTSVEIVPQSAVQFDGFAFDDLTVANPEQIRVASVPEPSAILGLSWLAIGGYSIRKLKRHK